MNYLAMKPKDIVQDLYAKMYKNPLKGYKIPLKDLKKWKDVPQLWMEKPHLTSPFSILPSPLDLLQEAFPDSQGKSGTAGLSCHSPCGSLYISTLSPASLCLLPQTMNSLKAETESSCLLHC